MADGKIEWPIIDTSNKKAIAILDAFRNQTVIEIDGRKCLVVDAHIPRGRDDLCYRFRYLDDLQ
jgi:hypothetical protein